MNTDSADSACASGSVQSSSIADLAHETKRNAESPETISENNQPKDPFEPTVVNPSDIGNVVNEGDLSTSNNGNQEDIDKNSSTNSIIWLESTINMSAETSENKREGVNPIESIPCAPSNDGDVEMCDPQGSRISQEVMDIDDDMGAVGGTVSQVPQNDTEEQKVDPMKTEAAQNGVKAKCCNPECCRTSRKMFVAPLFVLSCYEIRKKKKKLSICNICFDRAVAHFEKLGGLLVDQRPLCSVDNLRHNELVEILDSSDEETECKDDDVALPSEVVSLVERELQQVLEEAFKKYNIGEQIDESTRLLREQLTRVEEECEEMDRSLRTLSDGFDAMQNNLYSSGEKTEKQLPPISIVDDCSIPSSSDDQSIHVSKPNHVERKPVEVNGIYFGMRRSLLGGWTECMVMEEVSDSSNLIKYMVQFLTEESVRFMLGGKHIAYSKPSSVRLHQGMRIIAKVDPADLEETGDEYLKESGTAFYAGVIAETLSTYNNHRYLVIFDNGYTHYAQPWNVRVVCEQSLFVWEDVHPHSQEFVRYYLDSYKSVRPMVQVKKGQRLTAEKDGRWRRALVLNTDSSLVLLWFPDIDRAEWIFRGSKRLEPLYHDRNRRRDRQQISKFQKRNIPSIEYITIDDDDDEDITNTASEPGTGHNREVPSAQAESPVASTSATTSSPPDTKTSLAFLTNMLPPRGTPSKKSAPERANVNVTAPPAQIVMNTNMIYCDNDRPQGKTNMYTTKRYPGPIPFIPHECSPGCIAPISFDLKTYNLLARPLISGWERHICKARGKKATTVAYRGPCGRRLRYMFEVHTYLRLTKAPLNVENFDFDPEIRALATFKAENLILELKDLSLGKEMMPVSCVNCFDDTKPPPCEYSTKRIPTEGVNLNLDDDFLCGCDCEDDCFDKSRCQCWQQTIRGAMHSKPGTPIDELGYVYKRLDEPVLTGIYECNSRCKCKVNECLNRVVQHPLQTKLQVFRTTNRGWGIRSMNDIPKGSFICIYTGHLLTEETSNLICEQNEDKTGDEYFADLDYIETVEELKEGYESEANEPLWGKDSGSSDDSDSDLATAMTNAMQDSDDDFTPVRRPSTRLAITQAKLRQKKSKNATRQTNNNKPGEDRERVNLIPKSLMGPVDTPGPSKRLRSFRQLFGDDEQPYVIDAKKTGNLGRYFNHSCVPNLFVQNVFVDTHDLRFPWVAFFASRNIKAGSELTWNYSYDVGSVPGKVLFCHCGESECRKRLL
uniref:Histone-lysine N-methyltransferase n=1 Tax=Anopheles atroparvus TaxID=41427 RepID=A0A182J3P8_ANOAO